jgi:UDP-glucose:(heptosyl)LPS alpha-1,3-glucosyltransferase
LRLAFVLHHYFPYGGLQRDAWCIARACKQRGHQIEFLTMRWQGEMDPAMPVHLLPQNHTISYRRYQAFEYAVQAYVKQEQYDAVVGFNKMAGLDIYYAADPCFAATLAQRRWGKLYRYLPRYKYFLKAEAAVCSLKTRTHLLLISPQAVKDFKAYYHLPDTRLHFLPPGISRDRCWQPDALARRQAMREHLKIQPAHKLLLMVGSGFKTKGVDRSIRALAALPLELRTKTQLLIVGKDKPQAFMRLAKKLQVESQVQFILGSDNVPDLLFAADILLHPAYVENTGTVLLEAVVAGLPVLTTASCGYAFYIERAQAGCIVPLPFAQETLNARLMYMLSSVDDNEWHQNGIRFGQQEDLYSMPERAAVLIEQQGLASS